MSTKKGISITFCVLISVFSFAQFPRFYTDIFQDSEKLEHALIGGLIAPQFSEVDLNNDGIQDLYIFDKAGNVSLTFVNQGAANQVDYVYAPFYEQFFPELNDWVLLRDYNGDGIQDIFSYSDMPGLDGVIVYTGKLVANTIQFERHDFTHIIPFNVIPFPSGGSHTQVYITAQDYPAIDDIDGDGDLDILTFALGGGHVYLYDNQSVEMGYGADSLIFELEDDCWGRFYESGISVEIDLSDDIDICSNGFHDDDNEAEIRHAGSTLLTFDNDEDGDKEVLLGDISFNNLNLLTNNGTVDQAFMTEQDVAFPSYNVPGDISIFRLLFM